MNYWTLEVQLGTCIFAVFSYIETYSKRNTPQSKFRGFDEIPHKTKFKEGSSQKYAKTDFKEVVCQNRSHKSDR